MIGKTPASAVPGEDSAAADREDPRGSRGGAHLRKNDHTRRRRRRVREWLVIALVAVVLALVVHTFFLQAYYVPSGSMMPTIDPGDRILVDKFGSASTSISVGEIVVFHRPPNDTVDSTIPDLVKRVIGLPGQTIWSSHGEVYINGHVLAEPWLPTPDPLGPPIRRQTIPPDHYFVMGDNRAISYDSRYFGPISGKLIIGKVILLFWDSGHPAFRTF